MRHCCWFFPVIANCQTAWNHCAPLVCFIDSTTLRRLSLQNRAGMLFLFSFHCDGRHFLGLFSRRGICYPVIVTTFSVCAIFTGPVNQPELHLSREEYLENSASPGNDDIAGLYRCNHGFDANKHCIVLCYGSAYCGHFRSCRKIYPKQEVFTMFAKGKVIACVGHTLDKLGEKERKTHKCAVCPIIGFQPRRPERAPTQRDAK